MRQALAAAAALLVLTGCSGGEEPGSSATRAAEESASPSASASPSESVTPSESASPAESPSDDSGDAVEIEIEGDRVEPNGRRVEIGAGEPLTLEVESDRAAELHVHSSPEQVVQIRPGESTVELVIQRPGLVDVEEHDSGLVLLQLEVR